MDTLSVSISNRLSPGFTASPIDLNQVVILPSATVSPSCGIKMSIPNLLPRTPALRLYDATEPDDITRISARSIPAKANILDQHLWCVRRISIAKENRVVLTSFQAPFPIGFVLTEFLSFHASRDLIKPFTFQREMQDSHRGHRAGYQLTDTYCVSRNSIMPSWAPSRPMPLCLVPPNGAAGSDTSPRLSPIMPKSSFSDTRMPRLKSLV